MYVFVCVHTCAHVWRSEVSIRCLLQWFAPYFSRRGLLLNLEFTVSPRLTGQPAPRICLSLPLRFWNY